MNKVMVIGSSGAGKSVFSTRLSAITGLPLIHLDKHHWRPGWTEPPKEVWREQVAGLISRDRWIMDGNFGGTMEMRLAGCDTAIFLDLPRHICAWRVLKRAVSHYGRTRPDLAEGCPEKFDLPFLKWVWDFPERSRPTVLQRLSRVADRVKIVTLRSDIEKDKFLESLKLPKNGNQH
jgi:adenylate kinase family enzyme